MGVARRSEACASPSLAKLRARMRRLEVEHVRSNNLDFLAHARGQMDELTLEHRREAREIEREELAHEIVDCQDDCEAEERRERQQARRTRWHGFAYAAMRAFPYYRGLDLTKGQRAVLTALGAASRGKEGFEVAHLWLAKKAGVSETTVKTTIRRLDEAGLLQRTERRLRGKAMNLWNRYHWRCERLAAWAAAVFAPLVAGDAYNEAGSHARSDTTESDRLSLLYLGGGKPPSPPLGDSSSATRGGQTEMDLPADAQAAPCRRKALRHDGGGGEAGARPGAHRAGKRWQRARGMDPEDFADVARAAMRELGHELGEALSPDEVADAVEELKAELQPGFKDFFWQKALWSHGRERALMAFLETRLVRDMRRTEIPDSRPWNEREPIRNVNAYLWGILKNRPGDCRPEVTVCAKLDSRGVYTLPPALLALTRKRMEARRDLHRHASSAA